MNIMSKTPLISIIIPTYKRAPDMIKRSVQSVLNQTYENIEVIIVDDSPADFAYRDQVEEYIESLNDRKILYVRHEKNMGANVARNTGIKHSNGEYCAFLDDDDEWFPTKLEKQIQKFNDKDVGLVYCKAVEINEKTGEKRNIINEMHSGYQFKRLLKQNFIGSNSYVLISKDALETVGYYDENLPSHQDYDLFLRISKKYKIDNVPEELVKYFIHEGERISTNPERVFMGRVSLHQKFNDEIENDPELSLIWKIKSVPLLYKVGKKQEARKQFYDCLRQNPLYTINYLRGTLGYVVKKRRG